jgi:hypothetical protein
VRFRAATAGTGGSHWCSLGPRVRPRYGGWAFTPASSTPSKGKHGAEDLFPEYPIPKRSTSQRERSFRASNEFTEYRRSVGVEEVVPGRRRSLVNFHSFWRYFVTKAEQADQMEHIIAVVVGHKRTGMTLGRYSGGPLLEQARRFVEAVRLP